MRIALAFEESAGASSLASRYLHGPLVDQILADEQFLDGVFDTVLWPLADHQSTVRDLAEYDDATGTTSVANHIAYDAFGQQTDQTNAAVDHLFGYTGQMFDDETGLAYYRARWYDPAAGRFLNEDPIGFAAGDANLYRYVGNSPMVFTDPSGMSAYNPMTSVINSIAGVTSSLASPVMSVASSVASAASSAVWASLGGSFGLGSYGHSSSNGSSGFSGAAVLGGVIGSPSSYARNDSIAQRYPLSAAYTYTAASSSIGNYGTSGLGWDIATADFFDNITIGPTNTKAADSSGFSKTTKWVAVGETRLQSYLAEVAGYGMGANDVPDLSLGKTFHCYVCHAPSGPNDPVSPAMRGLTLESM